MGADIMSFLDRPYLYAQDLQGDTVVEFERVVPGYVNNKGGKKKMPMAYFKGFEKPLGLGATNCNTIFRLFGDRDADKMPGRRVTLYVTMTDTKEGMQQCIRIRPTLPPDDPKPARTTDTSAKARVSPPDPGHTRPLSHAEAALRKTYGNELKALWATLQITPEKVKERWGDLTKLSTERLGEICAELERERAVTG